MAVVVIGLGELGALFAEGFLRTGHTVVPILRGTAPGGIREPELCLVAVAEADLDAALASLPQAWRTRVGLLQNELLPEQWQRHAIETPTVAVVWFEKKPGRLVKELLPTEVFGPRAELVAGALERLGLSVRRLESEADLVRALVVKNLYILTTNIAGLVTRGTVAELFSERRDLALAVFDDVLEIQLRLAGATFERDALLAEVERAVAADPEHQATGRSAPARLARALANADRLGVAAPALREIRT